MRQIDLRALALDTFYHAGNLSQESETQYERAIGFKAGDNVERSGVPGAIYKVLKINDNGSATIRMFLDAENWDGPTTVVSYDNVRAGKLKKTDKAPRRRAKDTIKMPDYRLSNTCLHCNGTGRVMNGGMRRDCGVCRGTGKLGYSYKVYDAETSHDPRDGKFTSGGGSKSTGNPRRFGSSGRGRVSPEAEKRFAEEMEHGRKKPEAKDQVQVPQDCFDAQYERPPIRATPEMLEWRRVMLNPKASSIERRRAEALLKREEAKAKDVGTVYSSSSAGAQWSKASKDQRINWLYQCLLGNLVKAMPPQNEIISKNDLSSVPNDVRVALTKLLGHRAQDQVPQDCFDAQILGV